MRFEKLNENKIRITLSHEDLAKNDIDLHTFMSNSIESQDLFFDMLKKAEKEIGFVTKDYLIRIETFSMAGGDFILTVTRTLPEKLKYSSKKNVHIRRKKMNIDSSYIIYSFSTFDDYCSFIEFFSKNGFKASNFAKSILLYEYKNSYYLVLKNINLYYPNIKKLLSSITEFATFVSNSNVFASKLLENGILIMKNNAILLSLKHFIR